MSASPPDGGPVVDPEDPTGPGAQLREARRRANLSLEEVATQLRLDRRTVRALEENEFQYLPAPTFIRGYIRSYARLLGLPPGPILEAYDYQGFTPPDILADITQRPQARFSDFPVRLATYVVAAGLVAMVVMWWHSREATPEAPAGTEFVADVAGDAVATTTEPAAQNAPADGQSLEPPAPPAQELIAAEVLPGPRSDGGPATASSTAGSVPQLPASEILSAGDRSQSQSSPAAGTAVPRDGTVPVRDALVSALDPPPAPPSSARRYAPLPASTGRLSIRFSRESWVEIFDAEGIRREFRLATPGSRTSVSGTPPFNVLLGYAAGALVTFDGEDYDISRFIRGDTARFLIGPDGLAKARPPERPPQPSEEPAEAQSDPVHGSSEAAASQLPTDAGSSGAN